MRRAALVLFSMLAGCWYRTPAQIQRDYAQTLAPAATPEAPERPPGQLRFFRVRVYVDRDYQSQTPRWESHIEDQIDRANRVLEAQLGVHLQIQSMRVWDRRSGLSNNDAALHELMARDPGTDVDWVVGFLSSLQVFSAAHEQLGVAQLFSRHFVLRGITNAEELDAIDRAFDMLPRDERAHLTRERRFHKETAIFLHEWGHTLGAFHDADPRSLMGPYYEPSRSMFSPSSLRLVEAGLAHRSDRSPEGRAEWAKVYKAELGEEGAAFDAESRDVAQKAYDAFFAASEAAAEAKPVETTPAPAASTDLSEAERARIAEILRADDAGNPERAARLLVPIAEAHPRNARVRQLACYLSMRRRPRATETARACREAAALPDSSAEANLLAAQSALATGDRSSAVGWLSQAEARLQTGGTPASWLWAARLYDGASTCSGAERALTHVASADAAPIVADCKRLKRLVPLPPGIPIEREHEYVTAFQKAEREALRGHGANALREADALRKSFPGAPGASVITCLVESQKKPAAVARKSCESARSAAPEAFLPHYVLGLLRFADGQIAEARAELKQALDLEDSTASAWSSLAAVYRKLGDEASVKDLAARYRARFGGDLQPALWPAGWSHPK